MSETVLIVFSPCAVERKLSGVMLSRLMSRGKLELDAAQLIKLTADDQAKLTAVMPEAANWDIANSAAMVCLLTGENAAANIQALLPELNFSLGSNLLACSADRAAMAAIASIADRNNLLAAAPAAGEERTLLIIKPENFRAPSVRPGAILDMLMSLDLKWIGCKVHGMTIADALEFYGPVRQALRSKLGPKIGTKALATVENEFEFKFDSDAADRLIETVGNGFADDQFEQIVEFMAGKRPSQVPESEQHLPGGAKCMVLIFDGVDAVAKIRTILGPTNPAQATGGTVRYDFGTNIMVNASHASDSVESFQREGRIVRVEENDLSQLASALA
ncbi:MAG: nucleoside-diphosphate kinase [Lentisphaerae bacterium]|nr:nucleoside-diphosphate kinase [Lentisphaerota bacterium]